MKLNKIILVITLLFFVTHVAQAYCDPFFAQIDSIENGKDCLSIKDTTKSCGGAINVKNDCDDEFYFYDGKGELDENFVIVNHEEWNRDLEKFRQLKDETGIEYRGNGYPPGTGFMMSLNCYTCPNNSSYCEKRIKKELIIDGINVCDEENLVDKTTVKYWTVKIFSKKDNQDIIVTGRTVYEEPLKFSKHLLNISISLFIISVILLFTKYRLKKKIYIFIPIILLILSAFIFLLYYVVVSSMG